jgi:hypothetical protein
MSPWLASFIMEEEEGQVVSSDKTVAPIVHKFNRDAELSQFIEEAKEEQGFERCWQGQSSQNRAWIRSDT